MPDEMRSTQLRIGAILAGGRSRRFGSPKPLAQVGGVPLVLRIADSLQRAGARPVVITGPETPPLDHLLPCRGDRVPGRGPMGGLFTALDWASDLGTRGLLCVGCDTPFLPPALLREIAEEGERLRDQVVAPESGSDGRVEPLCAWYPTSALAETRLRVEQGALSLTDLLAALPLTRIPLAEVGRYGDPAMLFHNINTPSDGERAEAIHLRTRPGGGGG